MKTLKSLQIIGLKQLQNSASVKKGTRSFFFGNLLSTFMQNGQNKSKLPGMPVFGTRIVVKNQPVKQQQVITDHKPAIRPKSEKVESLQIFTHLLGKSGNSTTVKSTAGQLNPEIEQGILKALFAVQEPSFTEHKKMFKQPVKITETVFIQTKLKAGNPVVKFIVKDNSRLKQVTNFIAGIKQNAAAQKIKLPEIEVVNQMKIAVKGSALSSSTQKIKVDANQTINSGNPGFEEKGKLNKLTTNQKTKGTPELNLSAKQSQKKNIINDSVKAENNTGKIKEVTNKLSVPVGNEKSVKSKAHSSSAQKTKGTPELNLSAKQSLKNNIINDSIRLENNIGKTKEVFANLSVPVKKEKTAPEGKQLATSPDKKAILVSAKIKDGSISVKKSVESGKVLQPEFKKEISRLVNHSDKTQPVSKTGTSEKNEISTRTEVDKNLDSGAIKKAPEMNTSVKEEKEIKEKIQMQSQKSRLHPFGTRIEENNEAKKGAPKSKDTRYTLNRLQNIEKPVEQEYQSKPNVRQTVSKNSVKTEAQPNLNKADTGPQTSEIKAPNLQQETGLHQQIPEIKAMEVPEKFHSLVSRIREIIEKFENPAKHSKVKTSFKISGGPAGQMEINLAEKDNSKKIKIIVESESVRNELQKALPQIQQNLLVKGIEFSAFTIEVAYFGSKMSQAQDNQRNMQRDKSKHGKEAEDEQEQSPVIQKNYGYNTIEIIA